MKLRTKLSRHASSGRLVGTVLAFLAEVEVSWTVSYGLATLVIFDRSDASRLKTRERFHRQRTQSKTGA